MKPLNLFLLVSTIILNQGCRKDYCQDNEPDPVRKLSGSRFYFINGTYHAIEYKYSDQSKLISEKEYDVNGQSLFETFFHYQNDRLSIEELGSSPKISELRYTYNNQLLSETEYIDYQNRPVKQHFRRSFIYEDGNMIKIIEMDLQNSNRSNYTVLNYTGKNITSVKVYDLTPNVLTHEAHLEYDNKKNPFYGIKENTGDAKYACRNNVVSVKTLVRNGNPVDEVITYSYEYNSENYPIKKAWVYTGAGKLIEETYFYE